MSFTLHNPGPGLPKSVRYETDDICFRVGEISNDMRHGWRLHHHNGSACLKPGALAAFVAFADEQVLIIKVTERLLK